MVLSKIATLKVSCLMDLYVCRTKQGMFAAFWRMDPEQGECYWLEGTGYGRTSFNILPLTILSAGTLPNIQDEELALSALHMLNANAVAIDIATIQRSLVAVGEYYPRMWRGFGVGASRSITPHERCDYRYYRAMIQSVAAASSLLAEFISLFVYIEPHTKNYDTFGVRIRELLILACTEVEANWRGVLDAHQVKPERQYFTTKDYSKLSVPLKLNEWKVVIKYQPDLGTIMPFENWSRGDPTKTIDWYKSYNLVKHDRVGNMELANLFNLYSAMGALFVMQVAQWGPFAFEKLELKSPFNIVQAPQFDFNDMPVSESLELQDKAVTYPGF